MLLAVQQCGEQQLLRSRCDQESSSLFSQVRPWLYAYPAHLGASGCRVSRKRPDQINFVLLNLAIIFARIAKMTHVEQCKACVFVVVGFFSEVMRQHS